MLPFTFIGSEQRIFENIEICTSTGDIQSRIGGIIDRIDSKGESLRIVDYKTGGDADTPANVQSLFIPDKKRSNYVFQTFLYASIVCKKLREKMTAAWWLRLFFTYIGQLLRSTLLLSKWENLENLKNR